MSHIRFVDQTLRDGQQSLWGMRMRTGMIADIVPDIRRAGFFAQDVSGSSLMECLLRYSREDPWESFDLWRSWMPEGSFRMGCRSNCIGKFGITPIALMDLWIRTLARHGMDGVFVYDCLYGMDGMRRLCTTIHETGMQTGAAVFYGLSPVHTDAWFGDRVREMVGWGVLDFIYFEDASGILTPERTATLIPALLEAAGDVPVEVHCHNNTGLGSLNYLEAVRQGVEVLHTCSRPLANGPSLPSTESMARNLELLGYTHDLDAGALDAIAAHLERVALQEGHPLGVPNEYSVFPSRHQLPGGMTGTLKAQLAQYDMEDRLDEVLEEVVQVRADLGHPISATPFSQLTGIQAVLNIVTGERYSVVPDEVLVYAYGHLGTPPAAMDPDVLDRITSSARAQEFADWEPPQPTLDELRLEYGGSGVSDEELLCRYLAPADDVEATRAAGPANRGYEWRGTATLSDLVERALEPGRAAYVQLEQPGFSLTLRRSRP